jgi:hypothetical protein
MSKVAGHLRAPPGVADSRFVRDPVGSAVSQASQVTGQPLDGGFRPPFQLARSVQRQIRRFEILAVCHTFLEPCPII